MKLIPLQELLDELWRRGVLEFKYDEHGEQSCRNCVDEATWLKVNEELATEYAASSDDGEYDIVK